LRDKLNLHPKFQCSAILDKYLEIGVTVPWMYTGLKQARFLAANVVQILAAGFTSIESEIAFD
jgi:hypothetical protein